MKGTEMPLKEVQQKHVNDFESNIEPKQAGKRLDLYPP
jgi:hypothetical protein